MFKFKITFRLDQEEVFCTDDMEITAGNILEAVQFAIATLSQSKVTIFKVERID